MAAASVLRPSANGLAKHITLRLLEEVAEIGESRNFAVRFWDGTGTALGADPRFTLVLNRPEVLRALLESPDELTLGEAFIRGDLDVDGDLETALRFASHLMSYKPAGWKQAALAGLGAVLPRKRTPARDTELQGELHSRPRDRAAIASHYDISNDFYRLWLDPSMLYSTARFESPEEDLDAAQVRKLDSICQKLKLRPGDRFLDIGCGWGGLLIHAAAHYGVEAFGITLSTQQAELARRRIRSAGLEGRCAVRLCDYRDIETDVPFDKIASIGMVEHVGRAMLKTYFEQIWKLLREGGVFLLSGISASRAQHADGESFIDRYVFPDGDLVPLHTTVEEAESAGFEVRTIESLREHYALTLDRWVERLEGHVGEARKLTSDPIYRTWKLYMAASACAFRSNRINLYQTLLSKSSNGKCELGLAS